MPVAAESDPFQVILDAWSVATTSFNVAAVRAESRHMADSPLTDMTQRSVLRCIGHSGPLRLNEVAEMNAMTPSNASKVVTALVRGGLVRRDVPDHDRRVTLLQTTPEGGALLRRLAQADRSLLCDRLAGFSTKDTANLASLMARFAHEVAVWSAMVASEAASREQGLSDTVAIAARAG